MIRFRLRVLGVFLDHAAKRGRRRRKLIAGNGRGCSRRARRGDAGSACCASAPAEMATMSVNTTRIDQCPLQDLPENTGRGKMMLAHKLNNPVVGAVLAIGIVSAISAALWRSQPASYPLGIKSDRLDAMPKADCSFAVWPYGCDWQLNASPAPPKRSKFGRRRQYRHRPMRFLS